MYNPPALQSNIWFISQFSCNVHTERTREHIVRMHYDSQYIDHKDDMATSLGDWTSTLDTLSLLLPPSLGTHPLSESQRQTLLLTHGPLPNGLHTFLSTEWVYIKKETRMNEWTDGWESFKNKLNCKLPHGSYWSYSHSHQCLHPIHL